VGQGPTDRTRRPVGGVNAPRAQPERVAGDNDAQGDGLASRAIALKIENELIGRRVPAPVFRPDPAPVDTFVAIQNWQGTVVRILSDSFVGRLVNLSGDSPEEEAEFFVEDVAPGDMPLLQEGSVFYWSIGYRVTPYSQRFRSSTLRFRRLPTWTREDLENARESAAQLRADLDR
jgi:hypothetical protein